MGKRKHHCLEQVVIWKPNFGGNFGSRPPPFQTINSEDGLIQLRQCHTVCQVLDTLGGGG